MAIFTPVSDTDIKSLLVHSSTLGEFVSMEGISVGIENTNYFLTTTKGEYVLTLFEVLKKEQLTFYIELMRYLSEQKLPVPEPKNILENSYLAQLHGKPCIIVSRLPGKHEPSPCSAHCTLAGSILALIHLTAKSFSLYQPNFRGLSWWIETADKVTPFLNGSQKQLLGSSLEEQCSLLSKKKWNELPGGPSHCDLFRDNVLFNGTIKDPSIGGVIDFYFAGHERWLFDIAISVNDWCIVQETGEIIPELFFSLIEAYMKIRPLTPEERIFFPIMLRGAALRFWLSRLYDLFLPRPAKLVKPHDPAHFERILIKRTITAIPRFPENYASSSNI